MFLLPSCVGPIVEYWLCGVRLQLTVGAMFLYERAAISWNRLLPLRPLFPRLFLLLLTHQPVSPSQCCVVSMSRSLLQIASLSTADCWSPVKELSSLQASETGEPGRLSAACWCPGKTSFSLQAVEDEVQEVGSEENRGGSHVRILDCCRPPAECWDDSTIPPCFVSFLIFLQFMSLWLAACWCPGKTSFSL